MNEAGAPPAPGPGDRAVPQGGRSRGAPQVTSEVRGDELDLRQGRWKTVEALAESTEAEVAPGDLELLRALGYLP